MPVGTWVSIVAVLVALTSLILARRDRQSQVTKAELAEHARLMENNKAEIARLEKELLGLRGEMDSLRRENDRLRRENYALLRNDDTTSRKPYDGTERRRNRRS